MKLPLGRAGDSEGRSLCCPRACTISGALLVHCCQLPFEKGRMSYDMPSGESYCCVRVPSKLSKSLSPPMSRVCTYLAIRLVSCRCIVRPSRPLEKRKAAPRKQSPRPHHRIGGVRWTARGKLARWISLGQPQRHRIRPRCKVYNSCRRPFRVQWERHRSRCLTHTILWLPTPSVAWHPLTRRTPRARHSSPSWVNMSRSPLQWAPLAHSSRTACRPSLVGCRRRCNRR